MNFKTSPQKNKHKNRSDMHRKTIRQIVTKQLKYNHPHGKKMTQKIQKARQTLEKMDLPRKPAQRRRGPNI